MRKNKEEIIRGLEEKRDWYLAAAKAWDTVTIEKTKSGKEFSQLARALKNAKVSSVYSKETHPKVTVYFKTDRYEHDEIDAFLYMDKLPECDPRREKETAYGIMRKTVKKTPEELRQSIQELAKKYKTYADEKQSEIEKASGIIDKFEEDFSAFIENIREMCGGKTSLYYAVMENIRNTY